jgi:hypothetical protein
MAEQGPGSALKCLMSAAKALDPTLNDQKISEHLGLSHSALIDITKRGTVPRPSTRLAIRVWTSGIASAVEDAFAALEMMSAAEKAQKVQPFSPAKVDG